MENRDLAIFRATCYFSHVPPDEPWFTVEELGPETWALSEYGHREQVHSYLLAGSRAAALVDTGLGLDNIKTVVERLVDRPIVVITTHTHWDHVGGHGAFADVLVHRQEADWLTNGAPLPRELLERGHDMTAFLRPPPASVRAASGVRYRGRPSGLLSDGDRLDLGGRELRIVHTPGHSPGHVCVHDPGNALLVSGDLVYAGRLFACWAGSDPEAFARSLERVTRLHHVDTILPGHNRLPLTREQLLELTTSVMALRLRGDLKAGSGCHDLGRFQLVL